MKKIVSVLVLLTLLLGLPGCKKSEKTRYEASFLELFDTVTAVLGYEDSEAVFKEKVQVFYDELKTYHELYDIYNDYDGVNNIKTINDNAGKAPVQVDQKIIDLLLFSKEIYTRTNGRVNVAMGSVLSVWHDYREAGIADPDNARLPSMDELQAAALHTDIEKVVIDDAADTVYLADPDLRLDVGAVAKGYAVGQVCAALKAQGYDRWLVSVGGNVCPIGAKTEDGGPWNVAIQDPYDTEGYMCTVQVKDLCVVTSGNYQRYYTVDGVRYHHIIDPDTLMPANYFDSVTVLCADSGLSDGLSTALFTLPLEQGQALVESLDGVEAVWVRNNGEKIYSSGFEAYLKD